MFRYQSLEVVRKKKVIIGGKTDQITASFTEGDVSICVTKMGSFGQVKEAHSGITETRDHFCRTWCAGISDHQQFEVFERLIQD